MLLCLPLGLMGLKVAVLGYSLDEALPEAEYTVETHMALDGGDRAVRVRTFLPQSDDRQQVVESQNDAPGLEFDTERIQPGRLGTWRAASAPDGTVVRSSWTVRTRQLAYELDPALAVPEIQPAPVRAQLQPTDTIQVDDPEIQALLVEIGADHGPLVQRLERIHAATQALPVRPFKGTTDALTALRLGEASCNGKSRLFVALARAAGMPARLVGGLVLTTGEKRTSHQWVEVYISGHWVPFCPTNDYFAELPATYVTLYRGDEVLFRHTADINFDYGFDIKRRLVPSRASVERDRPFNFLALFERLGLSYGLLRTLLMLPVGALVVVFFRNVVGMPTFGTFLPALIAGAASATGPFWGLVGLLVVMASVVLVRGVVQRLRLLHSPTLAILLAGVTTTLLLLSYAAEAAGLEALPYISMFPIAVLAISAERFYLALTERGPASALKELVGTLVVIVCCYLVMGSLALQLLILGFPETLLIVLAADIYLGRWVGLRVSEYLRFRGLLRGAA